MKKALLIIEVILLMFTLSACSGHYKILFNEQAESDKIAQEAIVAIESKD
jgi:uncharacterized protein YcfL